MTKISWQLVDSFSALLDASEREAVLGDFAESGECGRKALSGVLGLVVRRQLALWMAWRPWLTLTILVIPLGLFLSVLSRSTSDESAVYAWMYANNWDWGLVTNPGFWYVLRECVMLLFGGWLTLACWSWTAGFVLGRFSRGIACLNGVLLLLVLAVGEAVGAPAYIAYFLSYVHRHFQVPSLPDPNAPVFALAFYSAIFPVIIQGMLVAGPAIYGMRAGMRMTELRPASRVFFLTAAFFAIGTMITRTPGLALLFNANRHEWMLKSPEVIRALQFVIYWPALYLLAIAVRRRWPRSAAVVRLI
jgi:hypothetical protein